MPGIRSAVPEDAERLREIYAWYVENSAVTFEYAVPTAEEFGARIERTLPRFPWLVVECGGRVEGYAYAGPFAERAAYAWSCEVSIYLDRSARRQGLGRLLYEALERELRERGVQNLYACIAWPEQPDEYLSTDSAEFHARLGYTRCGLFRRCGYKFGRWYSMIWMEKLIGEHPDRPGPLGPMSAAYRE